MMGMSQVYNKNHKERMAIMQIEELKAGLKEEETMKSLIHINTMVRTMTMMMKMMMITMIDKSVTKVELSVESKSLSRTIRRGQLMIIMQCLLAITKKLTSKSLTMKDRLHNITDSRSNLLMMRREKMMTMTKNQVIF